MLRILYMYWLLIMVNQLLLLKMIQKYKYLLFVLMQIELNILKLKMEQNISFKK